MKIDADIIVIGGGASGLMAAITAAENGADVLLLEQQEKVGRKLSVTGNGRCNFTNADMKEEYFFQSEENSFVRYALSVFSAERAIHFFEESGIAITEKNGYYYPLSGQAGFVREALLFRFLHGNPSMHKCKCSSRVVKLEKDNNIFFVSLEDGYQYTTKNVILACGSMAAPQLGGSDIGIVLAKQMGHTIVPMLPALCGLKTLYDGWNRAANIRVMARISAYCKKELQTKKELFMDNAQLIGKEQGELQITAYGISGIPVFQLSGRIIQRLEKGETVMVIIDFLPQKSQSFLSGSDLHKENDFLLKFLQKQKERYPLKPMLAVLSGILPEKLAGLILIEIFGKQKKNKQETLQIQAVEEKTLEKLAKKVHQFELFITGQTGFEHAQAASGGVRTEELFSETMESKFVHGLYFAGELIDVVGLCGGYNLQWAWASGYLAGSSAAKK